MDFQGFRAWRRRVALVQPRARLHRGELDLRPPHSYFQDAMRQLEDGPLGYVGADPRLVEAVRGDLARQRDLPTSADQIAIVHGALGGIVATILALCKPGDEVLIPSPGWPALQRAAEVAHTTCASYPFETEHDAAELPAVLLRTISKHTRLIVLNSPHNPTGLCLPIAVLERVMEIADERGILVVADEAYENMGAGLGDSPLITSRARRASRSAILVMTVSKRYAAPALRVGIVRGPASLARRIQETSVAMSGGTSSILQEAARALFESGQPFADTVAREVRERRAAFGESMGWTPDEVAARGGLFVWLSTGQRPSVVVAEELLAEGISVTPGAVFGADHRIRISLCEPPDVLREAATELVGRVHGVVT
jgi:aspartate/methionine/tyrosine aminotransferase